MSVDEAAREAVPKAGRTREGRIADPALAAELGRIGGSRNAKLKPERTGDHVADVLRGYEEIESRLVARGFPPTSEWWRETIRRWYETGRRQLIARVGRRGGKSSTLSRLAVAEALYGAHDVPPGDLAFAAVVSTDRKEAVGRLRTIEAILGALGIAYEPVLHISLALRIDEVRDDGEPYRIGFRVFTASIAGVSGFTSFFVLCDEVSKWKDVDTGANPGREVLASVRPTMATMRNGRMVLSSSPFGMLDAHFDAFELGETAHQCVAYAPTWEANPTLTEDETHGIEPNQAVWLREFKAIPQAELESSLLTEALIDRAMRPEPGDLPFTRGWSYVAAMDPATRTNAWTLVVAGQDLEEKRHVVLAREWVPKPQLPLDPTTVLAEIATHLERYGLALAYTDQHAVDMLRAMADRVKLQLIEAPWTPTTKREGYEHLLKLAQANRLGLPKDAQVKMDLLGIRKVITRSGVQYQLAEVRGRHADYAPAVALAVADARFIATTIRDETPEERAKRERYERFARDEERPHWQTGASAGAYWRRGK